MKKIYLAGPDVFRENAPEHFNKMKELCHKYGFIGLSPFDSEAEFGATSEIIFDCNIEMIDRCDIIVANLTKFRGSCIDDGTAFEIGYAYAKDKEIWGYTEDYDIALIDSTIGNEEFPHVENFNLPRNLMICNAIFNTGATIHSSFENILKLLNK